ncbi:MAG: peptidase T [Bacilli bacterium]|jgi:tripeptide aminopeptidase
MSLLNSFVKYVKIDTQSDENSNATPSSKKQFNLLDLLNDEFKALDVRSHIDEFGRLYASIEGNSDYQTIGLCAHVDTASECSGKNVKPQIIEDYDGRDIRLGNSEFVLSSKEFPKLRRCMHKTIITADGTTLLGADDKAGIAIIMEVVKRYLKIETKKRYPMSILFTPDEEVGRGAEHFSKEKFGASYAYTIDGDDPKYISVENFNAKKADILIAGKSIHPGDAKGIMINAILVLHYFMSLLPPDMIPSQTENREGFNHVVEVKGDVEQAYAHYILRNHDADVLIQQVNDFEKAKKATLSMYPGAKIDLIIQDQYRNMLEIINEHPEAKHHIESVYLKLKIPFEYKPIRGGTDGASFSFLGCPTPNLGTGSYNHHGRYEFAVLEEMEQLVQIIFTIFIL